MYITKIKEETNDLDVDSKRMILKKDENSILKFTPIKKDKSTSKKG